MRESGSRSRFGRRQWRRRLAAAAPYLIGGLVVAALGFVGWVLFYSTWLAVDDVDVEGTALLSPDEVVSTAAVDVGTPLMRVDLDQVTDRLESIPEVAEASVHRTWPHTITISVTERTPMAAIRHDGSWWLMDHEGVIFRETGEQDASLPVVQTPGSFGPTELREVAAVVMALPEDLLDQTKRVHAATMDSITVKLEGGREIVWGSAAESERKVEVLSRLLDFKARVYDVSVPEQPTTSR